MLLFDELKARGFIEQITDEALIEILNHGCITYYIGFDPTAESFHVGQLAIFNLMRHLQKGGHRPIGLMGGATGMIGDPSGKNKERNLLTPERIAANIALVQKQLERFLQFDSGNKASMVNNYDWISKWSYLDFLRDVGKNFSINQMINRDSVSSRLERSSEGITYTEFSYMILQAFDFLHLNREYNCTLQMGGSDQWGNIVSGIDLIRRQERKKAFGLTMPLLTKSDGSKFGKSESGTIWLGAEKTSPYDFYQYFLRQDDQDIIRLLKILTDLSLEEIATLEISVKNESHLRMAQKKLAEEVTRTVHGEKTLKKVLQATKILFGEAIENLDEQTIDSIFQDAPSLELSQSLLEQGLPILDALTACHALSSKSQAAKLIDAGGVYVNNARQSDKTYILTNEDKISKKHIILRTGKKNYFLLHFSS